jgi:hypothetical protein
VTLVVTGNTISGRVFRRQRVPVSEASDVVDRMSMGHTVDDRSSNEAEFLWISCV